MGGPGECPPTARLLKEEKNAKHATFVKDQIFTENRNTHFFLIHLQSIGAEISWCRKTCEQCLAGDVPKTWLIVCFINTSMPDHIYIPFPLVYNPSNSDSQRKPFKYYFADFFQLGVSLSPFADFFSLNLFAAEMRVTFTESPPL